MDPLTVLRRRQLSGHNPFLNGQEYVFGETRFPVKAETAFRVHGTDNQYYTLQDLVFYLENKNQGTAASKYALDCVNHGLQRLSVHDQTYVYKYLTDPDLSDFPLGLVDRSRLKGDDLSEPPKKRQKLTQKHRSKTLVDNFPEPTPIDFTDEKMINWANYRARERPIRTRRSCLGAQNGKALNIDPKLLIQKIKKACENGKLGIVQTQITRQTPRTEKPIIVVPSSVSAVLNLQNARQFLESFQYVPHADLPAVKEQVVTIKFKSKLDPSKKAEYEIINDPRKLSPQDWDRIVAIISVGKRWQFQRWPQQFNTPEDLFNRCCGFYFYFDDTTLSKSLPVMKWRCKRLQVSKNLRHTDDQTVVRFWQLLHEFIPGHRNKKLFY